MDSTARTTPPTEASRADLTPDAVLQLLADGNRRFVDRSTLSRDDLQDVTATSTGQYPFAALLSCVDSRVPVEKVFDLGIGDVFSARVAGNVLDDDLLGSLEFACALAGSKAIVVLGHTACGAVKGALAGAELGHLTGLLARITPAIEDVCGSPTQPDATPDVVDAVVHRNVERVVEQVRTQSEVLRDLESKGTIRMVGAVYDISSGVVAFL